MKTRRTRLIALVTVFLCVLQIAVIAGARGPTPRLQSVDNPAVYPTPQRVRINQFQRQRLGHYLAGMSAVSLDTLRVIALQVEFQDVFMEVEEATLTDELSKMRDYYRGASRGNTEVPSTLDGEIYSMPQDMGYYGDDRVEETRVVQLAQVVIDSSTATIDFSQYDHVFLIQAGPGQETDLIGDSRNQIWSSFYDQSDIDAAYPDTTILGLVTGDSLDGEPFYVDNFSIVSADPSQDFNTVGALGIWAFQIGNRVGMLPMFDSQPVGAIDSQGAGVFDMMAYGLFNALGFIPGFPNALNRILMGWVDPITVDPTANPRTLNLRDINTGADTDTVCLKVPITENEYYLVVNRVHDANFDSLFTFDDADSNLIPDQGESLDGAEFDFFLTDITNPATVRFLPEYGMDVLLRHTGTGVYVWHVDENVIRETVSLGYLMNDFVDRKGVDLEEADGVQDLDRPGPSGFALGSHFDSFRSGDKNQNAFGPGTNPSSDSNSGVDTGIFIENISAPDSIMQVTLRREIPYTETRRRWGASAWGQPATPIDLDGSANMEIIVLADTGEVYVFNNDGTEFVDADANPATTSPYIMASGAVWTGPPAFGNLDGGQDTEIVASSENGNLYAWKWDGSEVVDGDQNPTTDGILYAGAPMAAPPMLVDVAGNSAPEVAVVEHVGDSLNISFVDAFGQYSGPQDPQIAPLWPARVPGQLAAPVSLARTGGGSEPAVTGMVIASIDTLSASVTVTFIPVAAVGGPLSSPPSGWQYRFSAGGGAADLHLSPPATGDLDGDGWDDVVMTMTNGRLLIFDGASAGTGSPTPNVVTLRSTGTSAPALGDVDGDGTLEIALWDREFMYAIKSNGSVVTGWPLPIMSAPVGDQPPTGIRRAYESPVIGDVTGDGRIDIVYMVDDGSLRAYHGDASVVPGFPRTGTADPSTPSLAALASAGELSLVTAGTLEALRGADTVVDTFATSDETALAIQSLSGSTGSAQLFWGYYQGDPARQGRVTATNPIGSVSSPFESDSFVIYPNPVRESTVHARLTMNTSATVGVHVYNLEGEQVFAQSYSANPAGAINTPFDETIDVSNLKSGVYFLRLKIEGAGSSESLVKTFAIRR